jgi:hypothetical protein
MLLTALFGIELTVRRDSIGGRYLHATSSRGGDKFAHTSMKFIRGGPLCTHSLPELLLASFNVIASRETHRGLAHMSDDAETTYAWMGGRRQESFRRRGRWDDEDRSRLQGSCPTSLTHQPIGLCKAGAAARTGASPGWQSTFLSCAQFTLVG